MMKVGKLVPLLFLTLFLFTPQSFGKTSCKRMAPHWERCTSKVDNFATSYAQQKMSQWCWAACISMLFKYHGHPVTQERIVQSLWGKIVNLPSMNGYNIASRLDSDWVDDNKKPFTSRLTAVWDPQAGVREMDNKWVVAELDEDRPFINGSSSHATVVVSITYDRNSEGEVLGVHDVTIFDPWPGKGRRSLSRNESVAVEDGGTMQFVATAVIR